MLCMPFVEQLWGKKAFDISVSLSVLYQAILVLLIMARAMGIKSTAIILAKVILLTWAVEAIGVKTEFPFGSYRYTDSLQPQLLGVPLIIPMAWMMMLPPSWAVAQRLSRAKSSIIFIVFSAFAFTAWDLFLDPQMVSWDLWSWEGNGYYFGIPLMNFAGWMLTAALITVIVRPFVIPERPLLLIYSLTCVMETAGLILFWDLYGPAFCGFAAMGIFAFLAYYSKFRGNRS